MPDPSSSSSMEWYLDDLVVPRDQELLLLDRIPSPNGWAQWGVSALESLGSTNNYKGEQSICKEVTEMDFFSSEAGQHSNLTSLSPRGFEESSHEQAAISYEGMEQELNHLAGIDQMDDIFMSSLLLEEPTGMNNACGSYNFFPEFRYGVLPADNLFMDTIMESDHDPNHLFDMGSSNSPETWGEEEVASLGIPPSSEQKDNTAVKAPLEKVSVTPVLEMIEDMNNEASLEVSVLLELERVMVQLPVKTRICFRDALYRLANNSKQKLVNSQNGNLNLESPPPLTEFHDQTQRLENTKNMESKTNVIDRAVANLMFCKMNSNAQDHADLPTSGLLNIKQEAKGTTGHWHLCLAGDAEVPIFG